MLFLFFIYWCYSLFSQIDLIICKDIVYFTINDVFNNILGVFSFLKIYKILVHLIKFVKWYLLFLILIVELFLNTFLKSFKIFLPRHDKSLAHNPMQVLLAYLIKGLTNLKMHQWMENLE